MHPEAKGPGYNPTMERGTSLAKTFDARQVQTGNRLLQVIRGKRAVGKKGGAPFSRTPVALYSLDSSILECCQAHYQLLVGDNLYLAGIESFGQ